MAPNELFGWVGNSMVGSVYDLRLSMSKMGAKRL